MTIPHLPRRLRFPTTLALATFALILVRAVATADSNWDTLTYHWPFAARATGLCDRDCFFTPPLLEGRFDGFPMLLHTAQGLLWRAIGTPAMGDLFNVGFVVALCLYLQWRFRVPMAWSWLGFLAIPEAQIQLTSSYMDLPVNAAATVGLMVVLRMLVEPEADQRADVAVALVALAAAAGSKYQVVPVVLATWATITVLATHRPSRIRLTRRPVAFVVLSVAGAAFLLPKMIMNAASFANPFYPVILEFGPLHLPGTEGTLTFVSDVMVRWPRPARWIASVLEFDAYRGRPLPWTLGQGDLPQSSPSFRMGGYFVAYVLGAATLIGWAARSTSAARWAAGMMIALSILCAVSPSSHELRYNMFWMLALVASVLAVAHAPAFAAPHQPALRCATHGLVAVALLSVVAMTGGAYLRWDGETLGALVSSSDALVAQVPDGATLCFRSMDRRAFLHATIFHPGRHYRTYLLWDDQLDPDCTMVSPTRP